MAIFGDLEHLPFGDLARILKPQTGTLFLRTALSGRSVELHLHLGELTALFVDGFTIQDEGRLRDTLSHVVTDGRGPFEFLPAPPQELTRHLSLPLEDLMRAGDPLSPARAVEVEEHLLPHVDTRFGVGARTQSAPAALRTSWDLVQPYLSAGTSAYELSRRLGMHERQVRVMFYNLRSADLIAPLRSAPPVPQPVAVPQLAYAFAGSAGAPAPSRPAAAGPVQRFLSALRRLTGTRA